MAGRRPAPPALKLMKGRHDGVDSGGRKVNMGPGFKREPLGPAPEELIGTAADVWNEVAPELDRLELGKAPDRQNLMAYCLTVQRMWDAQADIQTRGILVTSEKGAQIKNPAVGIAEQASREMRAWAGEFGLTPSAEGRLVARSADPDDGDNPYANGGDNRGTGS